VESIEPLRVAQARVGAVADQQVHHVEVTVPGERMPFQERETSAGRSRGTLLERREDGG